MKILIVTQAVDSADTTLGFFHRWIEEFSRRAEKVHVVCLRAGEYSLPQNVEVFSLGKENTEVRIKNKELRKIGYVLRFYNYIWRHRNEYDVVFVHMNQEYLLLGGLDWKVMGKKVFFWRNHPHGDIITRIAIAFSDKVFYTSTASFTARYAKAEIMPAGIDTKIFTNSQSRIKNSLLMFGRIAPIKKIELAIDALAKITANGSEATLSVIGDVLPRDEGYLEILKDRIEMLGLADCVHFEKGVSFEHAPDIYQKYEICLNFTPAGSFDKTVIEALACGTKVLVSNHSMKNIFPEDSITSGEPDDIAKKICKLLAFGESQNAKYHEESKDVVRKQSLDTLMDKLFINFSH